ncbi:MAG TPA: hypothetical protein VIF84_05500 [Candidatus Limnocylindrales bacterium]|jgi:hypothetical protein
MERLRTRWAALVVALMLLLSVAGVAGASHITLPAVAAPQAQEQAEKHPASDEDDADAEGDADAPEDETDEDTDDADSEAADGAQGEHGALVSAVAQNKECVGGPNENHGWAVSQVARGLQVPAAGECPVWDPEVSATDDTEAAGKIKGGNSAEHRKDKTHKVKTHGRWATQP